MDPETPRGPPDEPEPIIVKPTCDCKNCQHFTDSADFSLPSDLVFGDQENTTCPIALDQRRVQPLLITDKHPQTIAPVIQTYKYEDLVGMDRKMSSRLVVHGPQIPKPVDKFTEMYFDEGIQKSLQALDYRHSFPLQSFAWPAIFRQLNVFLIGAPKTGKTMSYLPAVCTFALDKERYTEVASQRGPLVVILCNDSRRCEEIFDLLFEKMFVYCHKSKPHVSILTYPPVKSDRMDILVTLPGTLMECLRNRVFTLKRLCHLVLEDASTLLDNHITTTRAVLKHCDEVLENRWNSKKIQLVVCSERWSHELTKLLKEIYGTPVVCLQDYLEANLYGNIHMDIWTFGIDQKVDCLYDLLRDQYQRHSTVVVCSNDDIVEVNKELVRRGIRTLCLTDSSSPDTISECETDWKYSVGGKFKVFLCTDHIVETDLTVTDAMWLIHYSFPPTWTQFKNRFRTMSSTIKSPLDHPTNVSKCVLLIDAQCEAQMPKILNVLHRASNKPPGKYRLALKTKMEDEKLQNGVQLCPTLKLLGKCRTGLLCPDRHSVASDERGNDFANPRLVDFKVIQMRDVTRFFVHVLRVVDEVTGEVIVESSTSDIGRYVNCASEPVSVTECHKGDICLTRENTLTGPLYSLVDVTSDLLSDKFVDVRQLHTGHKMQVLAKNLYRPPADLLLREVILSNLVPPFRDHYFSGLSFRMTQNKLDQRFDYKNIVLTGKLALQLEDTLWLSQVVHKLTLFGTVVTKFNLSQVLVKDRVVVSDTCQLGGLYHMSKKYIEHFTPPPVTSVTVKRGESDAESHRLYSEAFLTADSLSDVYLSSAISPGEFYVQLIKFHPVLMALQKDIQKAIRCEIPRTFKNLSLGVFCLAFEGRSGEFFRAKILQLDPVEKRALCFFVDYGDEGVVEFKDLRPLPLKYHASKLPFQAIRCSLHGVAPIGQEWNEHSTDVLYAYMFEPDTDFFRAFYVKVVDTVDVSNRDDKSVNNRCEYSILLKDGFGGNVINQLLIDCGDAVSDGGQIEDFDIPPLVMSDSGDDEDSGDENVKFHRHEEGRREMGKRKKKDPFAFDSDDDEDDDFAGFECEILTGVEEFLEMLGVGHLKQLTQSLLPIQPTTTTATTSTENDSSVLPLERAIEPTTTTTTQTETDTDIIPNADGTLTPNLFWKQTADSITIKIKLIGVEKYTTRVARGQMLYFRTEVGEKVYRLKLSLYKSVTLKCHKAMGQEIVLTLDKSESLHWPHLTNNSKRLRFIQYEFSDKEVEERKRKMLDLDIEDYESSEDDGEMMLYDVDDMDTDLDEDIESDNSDV